MSSSTARAASDVDTKVGALIRARRRQLGFTLQQLSDASNLSVGYLSQVERDHATPTLGSLAESPGHSVSGWIISWPSHGPRML